VVFAAEMSESVLSPGVRPPLMVLSPDDQGPGISVATFIVLSITIETVVVRLVTMLCLKRRPAMEDVAIWIATVLHRQRRQRRVCSLI
jgi:hypothetical protein